jgi:hypothetical protein
MATAVSVMDGHATRACVELRDIKDDEFKSMDLSAILNKLRPQTAAATMTYIQLQDEPFKNEAEIQLQTRYENKILDLLTAIRHSYIMENMLTERIYITGEVTLARAMCLFVCGLLQYPGMSPFSEWASGHRPYASAFFAYVMEHSVDKTTVLDPDAQPAIPPATLQTLSADTNTETVPSFKCAQKLSTIDLQTLHDAPVIILDAFSSEDTFMQYHPVVWHLHCLHRFQTDDTMSCYAAKTTKLPTSSSAITKTISRR